MTPSQKEEALKKWDSQQSQSRQYLVIGGCGFLGREIVQELAHRGARVRCFDLKSSSSFNRFSSYSDLGMLENVSFFKGDMRNLDDLTRAMEGAQVVIHAASLISAHASAEVLHDMNVKGTQNVVRACQESPSVVQLIYIGSSGAVNAGRPILGGDETLPYPSQFVDNYSCTKAEAEQQVLLANGKHGVLTCVLRFHSLFGPGSRLVHTILSNDAVIIGSGRNRVDFVFVKNAVHAILLACEKMTPDSKIPGKVYFITNQEPWDVRTFLTELSRRLGAPPPRELPYLVAKGLAIYFETLHFIWGRILPFKVPITRSVLSLMTNSFFFDDSQARRDLGYSPLHSVAEGIALVGDVHAGKKMTFGSDTWFE